MFIAFIQLSVLVGRQKEKCELVLCLKNKPQLSGWGLLGT
jgi:hypothetical protein